MNPLAIARVLLVFGSIGYQLAYGEKPKVSGQYIAAAVNTQIIQSPGVITSPIMHDKRSSFRSGAIYSSGTSFLDDSWRLEYESNR